MCERSFVWKKKYIYTLPKLIFIWWKFYVTLLNLYIPAQSSVKCDLTSQRQTNSGFIFWENRSKKKKENKSVYICLFIIRSVSDFLSFDRFVELAVSKINLCRTKMLKTHQILFSSLPLINGETLSFPQKSLIYLSYHDTVHVNLWKRPYVKYYKKKKKTVNKYYNDINLELESLVRTLLL